MNEVPGLFGTPREWAKDMTIATAIGVVLGLIGPFGSFYNGSTELRVAYWVANMWMGFIILSTVVRLSLRASMQMDLPFWFSLAVGVAIGSLPLGFLIGVFSALFWPGNHGHLSSFGVWYGQTLVLAEPVSFAYYFLGDRGPNSRGWRAATAGGAARQACEPEAPESAALASGGASTPIVPAPDSATSATQITGAAFLDRLPPRAGRDLLCLQMEDHYVRAHTVRGSDLILTPLKDAIAELGDTPGMQVHRSWWVAKAAVSEPVANGRNLFLRLTNGLEVPVSRPSVAKLKAAGWLEK